MVSGRRLRAPRTTARAAGATLAIVVAWSSCPAPAAPLDPVTIAGVYKNRFQNGDVNGRTYTSEDVLEIVPLSPTTAYFKSHTEFYNGHSCSISGVGDVREGSLVYTDRSGNTPESGQTCRLVLRVSSTKITFEDDTGACKDYCGVRGSLDRTDFERKTRRTIGYMKLLRDSEDFHRAVVEHDRGGQLAPTMR